MTTTETQATRASLSAACEALNAVLDEVRDIYAKQAGASSWTLLARAFRDRAVAWNALAEATPEDHYFRACVLAAQVDAETAVLYERLARR